MSDEDKKYKDNEDKFDSSGNSNKVNNFDEDFFDHFDDDSNMEDADEDLLALLDMISAQDYNHPYEEDLLSVHPTEVNEEAYTSNNKKPSEDIIALDENNSGEESEGDNEFGNEEDIDNLVDSILDLNKSQVTDKTNGTESTDEKISDVGGIFSNVLSAVDLLDDKTEAEFAKLTQNFDNQRSEEKQDKLSLFQKLFGKKQEKKKAGSEKQADKAKAKKEAKEKKAKAETDDRSSKARTVNKSIDEKPESVKKNEPKTKKAKADKKKSEKRNADKKKNEKNKAAKKKSEPKVKPTKKAKKIVNEITDDIETFKVSRLVIIFTATFIILVSGLVILGTDAYSYTLNIKNARTNFERERYTEAYNEIYGLDVRKQDQEIYDKIITVMYVNKQINSYSNNMSMGNYPEALDSLLKGLERYDKYLERAKELGIKKKLDSLKISILEELASTFGLTEKEAKKLNAIEDQSEYSIDVISIAIENVEKVASE